MAKSLSKEICALLQKDIRELYLKGLASQEDIALKYKTSIGTTRKHISITIKEMADECRLNLALEDRRVNSEELVLKYGIPEKDKLKLSSII